jgi:hypothetical protein
MFNSLHKKYQVYKPTKTTNSLNEDIITYEPTDIITAFIGLTSSGNAFTKGSPQEVVACEYCGITGYQGLEAGDKIDEYLVKYVIPASNQFFFYCSKYE